MDLTPQELDALANMLAPFAAVVYIPATGAIFSCPHSRVPLHECPSSYTAPQAKEAALELAADGIDAVVVVYGIPWSYANAGKPAQGA